MSEISLPMTKRAQKVLALALSHATSLRALQPQSEHLLLGLLSEGGGVAAKVLMNQGVTFDQVRKAVTSGLDSGAASSTPLDDCLEHAEGVSLRLGHGEIGTEHLLIAMLAREQDRACRILSGSGLDPQNTASILKTLMARSPAV